MCAEHECVFAFHFEYLNLYAQIHGIWNNNMEKAWKFLHAFDGIQTVCVRLEIYAQ